MATESARWPRLDLDAWRGTYETLHMWTQIVGKIRLAQTPWVNHSWSVPLYVTVRGLTTTPMPHGDRTFQIDFDFVDHRLVIQTSDGEVRAIALAAQPVAEFYRTLFAELERLGLPVKIVARPNEVERAIRFEEDYEHASYDAESVNRLSRLLVQCDRVFQEFRSRFVGKASPVHLFWGSFDLAVTRFSGRRAPEHPGGVPNLPDWVVREAYSHEVSSCGFWPGGGPHPFPLFYSYAYPEPPGFASADVRPAGAFYSRELREFVLPYDEVRSAASPEAVLLDFLETTYGAAADLGKWDRSGLERRTHPRSAA